MIFGFSMVELVRINVSFVPKLKKIFSILTPSSGQTKSSIGSSHISLESVLHKLSFDIKISRLPVDPKKRTSLVNNFTKIKALFKGFLMCSTDDIVDKSKKSSIAGQKRDEQQKDRKRRAERVAKDAKVVKESLNCRTFRETIQIRNKDFSFN
jgi:hypothetical protein